MKMIAGAFYLAWLNRSPHAASRRHHEHLDEVGAGDGVERHAGLAGDGAREQGLTGSGGPYSSTPFGMRAPTALELRRVLQEVLDLLHLLDGLVGTGDIGEGDRRGLLRHEFRARLAELHDLAVAALGRGEEEPEEQTKQQDGMSSDSRLSKKVVRGTTSL